MQQKKARAFPWRKVLTAVLALVFVGSATMFAGELYLRTRDKDALTSMGREVQKLRDEAKRDPLDPSGGDQPPQEETEEEGGVLRQYRALYEMNPDLAGWVQVPGTQIDYPVMFTPTQPERYLRRNFVKQYSINGLPFLDYRNTLDPTSTNLIIYGHNIKDGAMFGELPMFKEESFWQEHKTLHFDTLYEEREYEIFAVCLDRVYRVDEKGYRYYNFIQADSQKELDAFLKHVGKTALFDTGIVPELGDELITLSTCSYHVEDGRLFVVARRVGSD